MMSSKRKQDNSIIGLTGESSNECPLTEIGDTIYQILSGNMSSVASEIMFEIEFCYDGLEGLAKGRYCLR